MKQVYWDLLILCTRYASIWAMSNTAPSRADPVVVFPLGRWCPPQETSQPHPPHFIHENSIENVVCDMTAILSSGRWVKKPLISQPADLLLNKKISSKISLAHQYHQYTFANESFFNWRNPTKVHTALTTMVPEDGAWRQFPQYSIWYPLIAVLHFPHQSSILWEHNPYPGPSQ